VQLNLHEVLQDVSVVTRMKGVAVAQHSLEIPFKKGVLISPLSPKNAKSRS
jgi:hypothetical protein